MQHSWNSVNQDIMDRILLNLCAVHILNYMLWEPDLRWQSCVRKITRHKILHSIAVLQVQESENKSKGWPKKFSSFLRFWLCPGETKWRQCLILTNKHYGCNSGLLHTLCTLSDYIILTNICVSSKYCISSCVTLYFLLSE